MGNSINVLNELKQGGISLANNRTKPLFIAVEGLIGVGKTSLATRIANRYQFHLLKEIVDENPFLTDFYSDIDRYGFQTEMFFLSNRFLQLETAEREFLSQGQPVVSDYHLFKNRIFAGMSLNPKHYSIFLQMYEILAAELPQPNLVIYLDASLETLLKRIELRGRSFEQKIDPGYLQQLSLSYEQMLQHFQEKNPHIPLLKLNGDQLDFVHRSADMDEIFSILDNLIHPELIQS